ncbi:Hypothetical protein FKW44_018741 [Caligus rogercresseyi]|uniref:Uncharacterized protein n=1 Tax=Caligus rogercresseyi TaxID=217165 RepID=A0A7T8GVF1_CALRO|nr:Hypothetical protein FKW44_018741 [Caligus rogercresseyi]
MPKAVASVTSVPTRADYQPQLEANLERKRKRDSAGGFPGFSEKNSKGGYSKADDKGSKKKRGRGSAKEDQEYKPKFEASKVLSISEEDKRENARKTRGKPPKKCLAESPPHPDPPENDLKAQHMIFAEKIRSSFDEIERSPEVLAAGKGGGGKSSASSSRRSKKRKKEEPGSGGSAAKAPRIVIKFSKEASSSAAINEKEKETPSTGGANNITNGMDSYDFANSEPGEDLSLKLQPEKRPKIKIKI